MNRNRTAGTAGPDERRHRIRATGAVSAALLIVAVAAGIIVLTGCGQDLPEPPRFSGNSSIPSDISEVPRITAEQVKQRLDAGVNLVIVDVRSTEEYEKLHIAGALFIPWEEIAERQSELYPYDEVVTYCG